MGWKTSFVLFYLYLNIMLNYATELEVESTNAAEVVTTRAVIDNQEPDLTDPFVGYNTIPGLKGSFKFYIKPVSWDEALKTCIKESAAVYYPESQEEFDAVIDFWREKERTLPIRFLLGMVRTANGFKTLDGRSESSVYTNWGSGEPNNSGGKEDCVMVYIDQTWYGLFNDFSCTVLRLPFICKSFLEVQTQCQMPSSLHYLYTEQLGKCYKFHLTPKTWSEARDACRAEHSDLAVINSREEAEYLVSLTRTIPRTRIPGSFLHGVVLLGFHKNNVEDWQTIEDTSLYDSGYACWGNNQPDGGKHEKCGAMFYNGHLTDVECDKRDNM